MTSCDVASVIDPAPIAGKPIPERVIAEKMDQEDRKESEAGAYTRSLFGST